MTLILLSKTTLATGAEAFQILVLKRDRVLIESLIALDQVRLMLIALRQPATQLARRNQLVYLTLGLAPDTRLETSIHS